ncbi:MAG: 2-amino-4-hydroxy-6-hydroxymethyldihydropteridine diphosphokinase [Alistipes sp.]|nr:2-amino-4-hydroxy-6-hydroxymethyldihydropteridine diphosphokinase [Alistipes sp.]
MTTEVTLLLGSNAEDAEQLIDAATDIINIAVGRLSRTSEDYRSEPYGFSAERKFVNRAVVINTTYDAYEVLHRINHIEALLGRDREAEARIKQERNEAYASRPIDIDIIFYGTETFQDERLTIPYHFLAERGYALRPVVDVMPDMQHPALKLTPRQMLATLQK